MSILKVLVTVVLLAMTATRAVASSIWYVKAPPLGIPTASGTSWHDAMTLDAAIAVAAAGDEIRIAEGTYVPSVNPVVGSTDPRDKSFRIGKSIKLRGGWLGYESGNQPPLGCVTNTILSGEIDSNQTCDNVYHVVSIVGASGSSIELAHLTLSHGNAIVYSTPCGVPISSLTLDRDHGAGIYITSRSTVKLTNMIIKDNNCEMLGGGVYAVKCNLEIKGSVIGLNTTSGTVGAGGGGIYLKCPIARIDNTSFNTNGNESDKGGAVYSDSTTADFVNCQFLANAVGVTGTGGAVSIAGGEETNFYNCTFSENIASATKAESIDVTSMSGLCGLFSCLFFSQNVGPLPQHFSVTPGTLEAASSYLQIPAGFPLPTDVSTPPFVNLVNVGVPIYYSGTLSLDPFTPAAIRQGGDPASLPADVLDLDGDGITTEPIPVDRMGGLRLDPVALTLSMGAYEVAYTYTGPICP